MNMAGTMWTMLLVVLCVSAIDPEKMEKARKAFKPILDNPRGSLKKEEVRTMLGELMERTFCDDEIVDSVVGRDPEERESERPRAAQGRHEEDD